MTGNKIQTRTGSTRRGRSKGNMHYRHTISLDSDSEDKLEALRAEGIVINLSALVRKYILSLSERELLIDKNRILELKKSGITFKK